MRHKKIVRTLSLAILLIILMKPSGVFAYERFYSYFMRGSFYGIWAFISTPLSPPSTPYTVDETGQFHTHHSNSLSTYPGGSFAQVGWLYYPDNLPLQYYEWQTNNGYDFLYIGFQEWNTILKYKLYHHSAQKWCVWIEGLQEYCFPNTDAAPNTMVAQTEVHIDPNTRLSTQYTDVRVKEASGNWIAAGVQAQYMGKNYPYSYTVNSTTAFTTSRLSTTDRYIPLITECDVCGINP